MTKKYKPRLNLDKIIASLTELQTDWPEVNARLFVRRENLTDEIIQNMALGYRYVDDMLEDKIKPFSDEGIQHLLELNHVVLCGRDPIKRLEYTHHLVETRRKFFTLIQPIKKWYKKHKGDSGLKVAAEVYVGVLSQPQLFIEGNHRTGALIASWLLLRNGYPPFVLNKDNALAYFDPSSHIKLSDKRSMKGKWKLPKYEKDFKRFLEANISADYVIGRVKESGSPAESA